MSELKCSTKPGSPECIKCPDWVYAYSTYIQGETPSFTWKCQKLLKEKWK